MSTTTSQTPERTPDVSTATVRGLKPRQLTMMGLGGAIGAGLFLGSGKGVAVAGPAILISYIVAGALVVLVMWMIGELSAANPTSGAFSAHAQNAFGPVAGYTVGWLYWVQLAVVTAAEANGAATILTGILGESVVGIAVPPTWVLSVVFMAVFTVVNMFAVSKYGEFEFWFAFLKVGVILAFLVVGILMLLGVIPGHEGGLSNFTDFAPTGIAGVGAGLLIVIFAFGGTEIVAIAAGETADPQKSVATAIRTVAWRIVLFYIGTVFIIVAILKPSQADAPEGPFAAVLNVAGLPAAGSIMALIAVFALLSALNANIYAASRMMHSLAQRNYAPAAIKRTASNSVPRRAVLLTVSFGFIASILEAIFPGKVLETLLSIVGSTIIMVWISVSASQITLRHRRERENPGVKSTTYRMPLFPFLSYLTVALLVLIIVVAMLDPATRTQLLLTVTATILIAVTGIFVTRRTEQPTAVHADTHE
ncbi:amino acid transporter [Kocuria tytonicola]|uniref:amino acid permease n=1 Tax=Kocuria tytonicola TaxID=2055946 RepID=UPI000EF8BAAE|nr:amino acid permease [Kocuria tytonicola]RLZ02664.1 amino acid transporter [Kocuria tytonicola]